MWPTNTSSTGVRRCRRSRLLIVADDARFFEAVGRITGLCDYYVTDEQLGETLRGLRGRVTAEELELIGETMIRLFANGMALGSRR